MTSLLEERYRRALRLLPDDFRERWADDMVDTFLDRAYRSAPDDPEGVEIASPRWRELGSVAALAIRLRLGDAGASARAVVLGEAVRRFALAGLLAHAAFAVSGVLLSVWTFERTPPGIGFDTRGQTLWSMTALLWLPAYLSLLFGRRRTALVVALAAYVPMLVTTLDRLPADLWAHTPYQIAWLIFGLLPIGAMIGYYPGAPTVPVRPWVLALPAAVLVLFAAGLLTRPTGAGLWCAGAVVAAVVARGPAGALTAAMLAIAVGAVQITTVLDFGTFDLVSLALVGGTAAAGLVAGARAAIGLRRLAPI
jgi:hypothetical protein